MPEPKRPCSILTIEKIAAYLGCAPSLARTTLRRLAKGNYIVEVSPSQWVSIIPVEILGVESARIAALVYTPPPPPPFCYASARDAVHDAAMARIDKEMAADEAAKAAKGKPDEENLI